MIGAWSWILKNDFGPGTVSTFKIGCLSLISHNKISPLSFPHINSVDSELENFKSSMEDPSDSPKFATALKVKDISYPFSGLNLLSNRDATPSDKPANIKLPEGSIDNFPTLESAEISWTHISSSASQTRIKLL
jgi:hypothetical protein